MDRRNDTDNAFRQSIDTRLSGLAVDEAARATILRRVREQEESKMKRKISVSLVIAIVTMLALAATACAAALRFSVLDYNPDRQDNEAFAGHVVAVDQTYENDYFSLHVNEAVFDGSHLSMTMEIEPRDGADEVYIIPRITAQSGERTLDVDIEGFTGADFFSGFFVPTRQAWTGTEPGLCGVDAVIVREEDDAIVTDVQNAAVTWTVTFHVLKPQYEVVADEAVLPGDDGDFSQIDWDAAMQRYRDAYDNHQILLSHGYSLVEYAAVLPEDDGRWEDTLVASGAFARADTIVAQFHTKASGAKQLSAPQTFALGDYECTVTQLSATFANGDYRLEIRKKAGLGNAAQEYANGQGHWAFAVLAPGRMTKPMGDSCGVDGTAPDGIGEVVYYSGTFTLDGETDAVTFVPVWVDAEEASAVRAVWNAQKALTPDQEAMAFTVKAE